MSLLELTFLFYQDRGSRPRRAVNCRFNYSRSYASLTTIKRCSNQFQETRMFHIPCGGHDKVIVRELACMKRHSGLVIERRNRFPRAFYRAPQRMIREISSIKQFSEQFVWRILNHLHFFKDNHLLALQVILVKTGVSNDIGQKIESLGKGGVRNLGGETCHLMRCISIEIPPKLITFNRDIPSSASSCSFEYRMLNEMADSLQFGRLVTRSPADPDTCCHRPEARHVFRQDGNPVGEFC